MLADKKSVLSVDQKSVVSADKKSVVSADKNSVVSTDTEDVLSANTKAPRAFLDAPEATERTTHLSPPPVSVPPARTAEFRGPGGGQQEGVETTR